jgi:hypothetical protein
MKKLVVLSQEEIEYVYELAKKVSDPRSKKGDFSKALRKIIQEHGAYQSRNRIC